MMRGQHDLRWTVVAGHEGSASSEDALALAQSFLGAAGGRLVVGCVYEYQPLGGRFASGELAAAAARRGCKAVRNGAAVRAAAAIALAEEGAVRVYATAGALPGDIQEVLAPLLGGAPLQATAPQQEAT